MCRYTFETVWPNPAKNTRDEVVDFWLEERVLAQGKAEERAAQLLVVCRHIDGVVAAVSTAMPTFVERLGLRCFYFRAFVGPAHRVRGLRSSKVIHQLVRKSYDALNARFQQGIDVDCVGLYLEIENPNLQRHRNELIWTDDGASVVFVGISPGGHHARIWYFDKAKLPRPVSNMLP